ncbi:MAG TPA: glycosyltransferase [Gemmatimonadaceae bacterium]|nr:glycosyltransferase [Gemmatimonadaceae bacterium]
MSAGRPAGGGARICLTTFGSFGDLHPVLGLARELRARGHAPIIATAPIYREIVEGEGISFAPMRPDLDPNDRSLIARIMDRVRGTERLMEEIMPHFRDSYRDLLAASDGADVLVSHPITFAGPVVAEQRGLPWASMVLSPMSFFSAYDFPVLPPVPRVVALTERSPAVARALYRVSRVATRRWTAPVHELRAELGLPRGGNPIFEGQHSPRLVLAMFSRVLAEPQPDWPERVHITGGVRYDGGSGHDMPEALERFLDEGDPPIVFTLGSAAVGAAGSFYEESASAAMALGRRAVLVAGTHEVNRPRRPLPEDVLLVDYAPYSALFPRAAAVVHQGGIGTLHRALAAGHPMIVVPFAHDQPDNAHRAERLGISRTIYPSAYRAERVARTLASLLDDRAASTRAREIGRIVRAERGAAAAAEAIEELAGAGTIVRQ